MCYLINTSNGRPSILDRTQLAALLIIYWNNIILRHRFNCSSQNAPMAKSPLTLILVSTAEHSSRETERLQKEAFYLIVYQ